jgi:hypothetical protein
MSREEDDRFYKLMEKIGQEDSPADTGESTTESQPDPYPNPPSEGQAEEGTTDARWGQEDGSQKDPSQSAQHHSNAVLDEFRRGREEFLQRHFNAYPASSKTNQKVVSQALSHGSGDYGASTAMLDAGSKRSPAAVETVVDKTKRVLDQY